jgi:cytochrome c oxidase subunit II
VTGKILRALGAMSFAAALSPVAALAQDVPISGQPLPGQIGLHESVTAIMDSVVVFHDGILLWTTVLITLLVLVLLIVVVVRFNAKANPTPSRLTHNTAIEVAWTVTPILILVVIAVPSFGVLADQLTLPDGERRYLGPNIFSFGDVEVPAPELTIKATGQQWYWDYEYVDQGLTFSSNMMREDERLARKPGQPRLLAVDYELVVPVDTTVRVQVTADPAGVIHAFGVPSFGVKIDAVPGRLNETWFNARKTGLYYGQCYEFCGKDHAFMPIAVRVVTQEEFAFWLETFAQGFIDDANDTLPTIQ